MPTAIAILFCGALCLVAGCQSTAAPIGPSDMAGQRGYPQTLAQAGALYGDEGIVFGSMHIDTNDAAAVIENWRAGGSSVSTTDANARYSLRVIRLGRRGQPLTDRIWQANCHPGRTCSFLLKLDAGEYVANYVRISNDAAQWTIALGSIVTQMDYRFRVDAGQLNYIGRLRIRPPVHDDEGKPVLPITLVDASSSDADAVGVPEGRRFAIKLIDARWQSRPAADAGPVR